MEWWQVNRKYQPIGIVINWLKHSKKKLLKDLISDNRVIMTGSGHKTETMLNHYSEHVVVENALDKLEKVQEKLFLTIIEAADVEYSFCDE